MNTSFASTHQNSNIQSQSEFQVMIPEIKFMSSQPLKDGDKKFIAKKHLKQVCQSLTQTITATYKFFGKNCHSPNYRAAQFEKTRQISKLFNLLLALPVLAFLGLNNQENPPELNQKLYKNLARIKLFLNHSRQWLKVGSQSFQGEDLQYIVDFITKAKCQIPQTFLVHLQTTETKLSKLTEIEEIIREPLKDQQKSGQIDRFQEQLCLTLMQTLAATYSSFHQYSQSPETQQAVCLNTRFILNLLGSLLTLPIQMFLMLNNQRNKQDYSSGISDNIKWIKQSLKNAKQNLLLGYTDQKLLSRTSKFLKDQIESAYKQIIQLQAKEYYGQVNKKNILGDLTFEQNQSNERQRTLDIDPLQQKIHQSIVASVKSQEASNRHESSEIKAEKQFDSLQDFDNDGRDEKIPGSSKEMEIITANKPNMSANKLTDPNKQKK